MQEDNIQITTQYIKEFDMTGFEDGIYYIAENGSEIKVEGNDYLIMSESDILGIVN